MSLCRWSNNDYQCDLYVYEADPDGYSINVAKMRRVWLAELPPSVTYRLDDQEVFQAYLARVQLLKTIPYEYVPIGLAYDGMSFSCDTAEQAIDILTMLQEAGYNAPYEMLFEMLKGE